MDDERLKTILSATVFGEKGKRQLACPDAFRLAAEHDVKLKDIARVCNREDIRFCKCQLGCF